MKQACAHAVVVFSVLQAHLHGHTALAALCLPSRDLIEELDASRAFLLKGGPAEGGEKAVMRVLQLVKSSA